jgi:SAM-dependent methyltransferase
MEPENQPLEAPEPAFADAAALQTHRVVYGLLRARVKMGCVLDAPCGSGAFARLLLDSGVYRVAALDRERRPGVPDMDFRAGDLNDRLPFPSDSFDAVVSIGGVEHLSQPCHFIHECNRVLRPGGVLIVTAPNISSLRSRWRWFATGFHNKSGYPLEEQASSPEPMRLLSFPELRYLLHSSGFQIQRISTNRSRAVDWLYGTLVPLQLSMSLFSFWRAAKTEEQRRQTGEILRQMMSVPILFGENMIVVATETMKAAHIKQTWKKPLARPDLGEILWGEPSCRVCCPAPGRGEAGFSRRRELAR